MLRNAVLNEAYPVHLLPSNGFMFHMFSVNAVMVIVLNKSNRDKKISLPVLRRLLENSLSAKVS